MPRHPTRRHTAAVAALAGLLAATAGAQPPGPGGRPPRSPRPPAGFTVTSQMLQRVGDYYLDSLTRAYGEVRDPALVGDVDGVMKRLSSVAGLGERDLRWRVVQNPSVNAVTLPGGRMLVYAGLLDFAQRAVRDSATGDGRSERDRYLALLAAVIGHEIGHVALGHSDSTAAQAIRAEAARLAVPASLRADASTAPRVAADTLARLLADTTVMNAYRRGRAAELAADRIGALWILRAGWRIQDAMDLFRRFGAADAGARPAAGLARDLDALSWFRDHPRASVREAELETFRASLKRNQGRLDDALVIVENGVMLGTATAMLDSVIADFPELAAARHARAAATHQQWIATRSAAQAGVQSITTTYSARFIGGIRGGRSDSLLAAARQAYGVALRLAPHPYTLANLALLDAYAGARDAARRRADSALALAPDDTAVRVNAGATRYLIGDYAGARTLLAPVARDVPQAAFNLGRTLLQLGDTAGAARTLAQYLNARVPAAWAVEARRLLATMPATTTPPQRTAETGPMTVAMTVAGIRLGSSPATVVATLGRPTSERLDEGGRMLVYEEKELLVVVSPRDRVKAIVLFAPEAGEIDGVRVGAAANAAALRWGRPDGERDSKQYFQRDGYWILLQEAGGVIVRLQIALD